MLKSSSTPSLGSRSGTPSSRRRRKEPEEKEVSSPALGCKTLVLDFDIGVFSKVAEHYTDQVYADMARLFYDKAPPGSLLRNTVVKFEKQALLKGPSGRFGTGSRGKRAASEKDPNKSVVFHLPSQDEFGGMNWDLTTYALPTGRDKDSRDARRQLFKYIDTGGDGTIRMSELKSSFVSLVSVPGRMDARQLVSHGVDRAFLAVQELMLDGMQPTHEEAETVSPKEFRVFLIFVQRYLELYEIFLTIDNSEDQTIDVEEFTCALPKLESWGLTDPALAKNPEQAFRKIDKDGSGEVNFMEFAEYCLRQGLIEEVEKEIRGEKR